VDVQVYYDNGRMMVQLARAFGRIALAGREMTRLAGECAGARAGHKV
jgi:hypothetical protein